MEGCCRRTDDKRYIGLILSKAVPGEHWRRLFRGDPDGARCLQSPYRLTGDEGTQILHHSGAFSCRSEAANLDVQILLEAHGSEFAMQRAMMMS